MGKYTKSDIIMKLNAAAEDISVFYQQDFTNYRGKTVDTDEFYTEIIAEWCCENIEVFSKIQKISRNRSYKIKTHNGLHNNKFSNRKEEIIAMEMFRQGNLGVIGNVIDYQTPLKNKRTDRTGKIDLLSFDGNVLYLLELKEPDSTETMLRCILEVYTYLMTADRRKLLVDFELPLETKMVAAPFVFYKSYQYDEFKECRPWIQRLMRLMSVKPWFVDKVSNRYIIMEDMK